MEKSRILQVLYDRQGTILSATFLRLPSSDPERHPVLQTGVIPNETAGQQVAELEVPDELARLDLHVLAPQLQVDVRAKHPKLVLKKR